MTVQLSQSINKELPGYVLTATLKPGAPLGEFKGAITITSNHPKQPKVEVPVTATIRGNIDLDRESFFLGLLKKGQTRSTGVTVSTVGKDPLKITKVDNPLSYLALDVSPRIEGKEYVVTATLKADAPVGNIKGDVVIHTNDADQRKIRISVYAFVEE